MKTEEVKVESENDFPVLRGNWPTVAMFVRLSTQWKSTGFGGVTGLDYCAVETLFRIYRVKNRKRMMDNLQVMEFAALKVVNEKAAKENESKPSV